MRYLLSLIPVSRFLDYRLRDSRLLISFFVFLFIFFVLAAAPCALAQARLDVFVTPVPNAPFSGQINVERHFVQRDGSIVKSKTIRGIGRDSHGRIYNEWRELQPVSSAETPQVAGILLYDPQTRASTTLNPHERTFSTVTVNRPPETAPPSLLNASNAANGLPQNQFTKEEDLGTQAMEGLPVHGVRVTQTIPAGSDGTGKAIVITDEYWYSEDLRINMVIKHDDPRTGGVTMTVTQVKRAEPDPARFEIPNDYTTAGARRETNQ